MGNRPRMTQLVGAQLLLLALALVVCGFYLSRYLEDRFSEELRAALHTDTMLLGWHLQHPGRLDDPAWLDATLKQLNAAVAMRFTIIGRGGDVLADSERPLSRIEGIAQQPEIAAALKGEPRYEIRYDPVRQQELLFYARPITGANGRIAAVVRAAVPLDHVHAETSAIGKRLAVGGLVILALAAGGSLWISDRLRRSLRLIMLGAERFAKGNFSPRLPVPELQETGALAEAVNRMAAQLNERIRAEIHQRGEQEAVLSSMIEGVVAVDSEDRMITLNDAAARLFGVDAARVSGRDLQEVIRFPALQKFVEQTRDSNEPIESEFVLMGQREQVLQAHGTVLRDTHGTALGVVVVLNDVTHLRRLERIRRDFVANVSHELRTPITSIKGFVETILDSQVLNPEEARHFLEIVAKQADRLTAIIEDLLTLSRVEQEAEQAEIDLKPQPVRQVLHAALELCAPRAAAKDVAIHCACPEEIEAPLNGPLLEQAVVNLLDNAIKYSDASGTVNVCAWQEGGRIGIEVEDHGAGIAAEHLPRLFERFYRVDKARSRALGGTGLGLAIVKHIAQTHGGEVTVESVPGQGSTFLIVLPMKPGLPAYEAPAAATP